MSFPKIRKFPEVSPGPYECQMGAEIVKLLRVFTGRVPDPESNARVAELAATPERWSAAHAVFDVIRSRLLGASDDAPRYAQYLLEESCCQAMYNAAEPDDPFDPSAAFFVVGQALALCPMVGVSIEKVAAVFWEDREVAKPSTAGDSHPARRGTRTPEE